MLSEQLLRKLQNGNSFSINRIDYTTSENYLMTREKVYPREKIENYKRDKEDVPNQKCDINVVFL
jgi:hypothetical protein